MTLQVAQAPSNRRVPLRGTLCLWQPEELEAMELQQAPLQVRAKHLCAQSTLPLSVGVRKGILGPLKYP